MEHASFNTVYSTPHQPIDPPYCNTQSSPTGPVCQCLSFSNDQAQEASPVHMDTSNSSGDMTPETSDDKESYEDEDFLTVPMDDVLWTTEMVPVRTFCIHENGLPNDVCSYPCPYGSNGTT